MAIRYVVASILVAGALAHADGERYAKKHQLDTKHMIVVSEGDYEPRSIGSYTISVYEIDIPQYPTDNFMCGLVRPRDGAVEGVLFKDLDGDKANEIIVTIRCAGSGSYLSADAFKLSGNELILLGSVEGLDRNADPVAALKTKLKEP